MYKQLFKIFSFIIFIFGTSVYGQSDKYKCMLQMKNYSGEGAYITAYIVNAQGKFIKTLNVMGDDKKWYKNLKQWYLAQKKTNEKLDAITGASVSGGKRNVFTIQLDQSLINKGYKIRFESAVEHGNHIPIEVDIPLETATIESKVDGKGYIRFVKLNAI